MRKIRIAEEFSRTPAGRVPEDGPRSGADFREQHLMPALRKGENITVYLDGVEGYGSSFLEEAFGGIVRIYKIESDDLHRRMQIESDDESLVAEIWQYIDMAGRNLSTEDR